MRARTEDRADVAAAAAATHITEFNDRAGEPSARQGSQPQRHAFFRSTADQSLGGIVEVVTTQIQRFQRGAEKPNRERENEELEGEKGIIRKRTASCIVPRKRPRDRFRTLDTERVQGDVEGGQRGAEQIKPNRNAEKRG